ncbi:MAG: electron transport complex subunit RsxE [Oscillospiraceae bacterium]|nr:electron transport complex subunit RsxE [Oscillospiraceae bacterium]
MNFKKQFKEGLLTKNPVTVQLLGMCSTLAITTSLFNGIGMGLAVTVITICSNVLISALRKVIPSQVRIAAYITIIAGFVTMVDLFLQAYIPALAASLGVFIPLIVVNCMVLGRAEGFASKRGILESAVDGLCQGIGYTVALVVVCVIRELLGNGTFGGGLLGPGGAGIQIIPQPFPAMQIVMPVGGFLVLGFVLAGSDKLMKYLEKKSKKKEAAK